ncbi:hypothetical protein [Embleya sp. MST-111070]|uniref:hypothetical protein n=1 Tax=Embleya sp. MST-111070 TaxID=3398231 RepID=UPI003F735046
MPNSRPESRDSGDLRWVRTAHADSLEIVDPESGRSAVVVRPDEDVLVMDDLVRLDRLASAATNLAASPDAHRELIDLVEAEPLPVLTGLSWIIALWCVACEVRTGMSAIEGARGLDYHGAWRRTPTSDDEHMWNALTQRVRIGVLAALSEDEQARRAFAQAIANPPGVARALAHHTVVLMDGFRQDMTSNGLRPQHLLTTFAEHTHPTTHPRRCFTPSRQP